MKQENDYDFNKQSFTGKTSEEYEEISEKKTSKLGYILLIIMSVFIIGISQTIFSDLEKIPERPISPSSCISSFKDPGYLLKLYYVPRCYFNEVDKKFNLDIKYSRISNAISKIAELNNEISINSSQISANESKIRNLNKEYDLSLQEKIANEEAIMDKPNIKSNITTKRSEISVLSNKNSSLETQRDSHIAQITTQVNDLTQSYDEAYEYYLDKNAYYRLKLFLLTLAFILPFFIISAFFYFRSKKKNSPYTIILTAIFGSCSILFLQVVMIFLYDVLPKRWLERIFKFFMEVPFLRYIIYYGSVILIIALFGGLVYFIQKKVFSPEKVAIRRLKENKCPGCSFALNSEQNYCPKCGQQIKEKCGNCNNLKIRYLPHCPHCGN